MTAGTLERRVPAASLRARVQAAPVWPRVLLGASGLALWAAFFGVVLSGTAEHSAQARLYAHFRQELAEGTAPVATTRLGGPVALLEVPRLHLRSVVVEGTAGAQLRSGPGHRRDTVLPGQAGVSVLYGRAVTSGAPFGKLSHLRVGDTVTVTSGIGVETFRVDGLRRPGDPLPTPLAANGSRLVLGSLEGTGWRSEWAPNNPLYVDATLTGKAVVGPRLAIGTLPAAEQLGGTDHTRLPYVILWLQLVVLAALGLAWARVRRGRGQAWLVGAPVLLALLWATTNEALALLPNVL